jgi:diguanylate cyclase (GGDEF)-like protein
MRRSSMGLRARLLWLVLAAVIPAFGLIGYTAIEQRQQAALGAKKDAMNLVRLAAREQSQLIASTRQLLMSLARLPAVRDPRAAGLCNGTLADLREPYPYYTNFGVATPDGNIYCSALPLARAVNIADRSYFQRAMRSRDFGIGDYQVGRITGIPAINFGYAIRNEAGNIIAVVYAALNLSWLDQLAGGVELPAGSTVIVVDSRGTVLAHHPDSAQWTGKSLRDAPLIKTLLDRSGEGTAELDGFDGVNRLYAFAPLQEGPDGAAYVSVGIPKAAAYEAANAVFARSIALLLIVALLALGAAWIGGDAFVLQRIRALGAAAQRLAKGDLSARTGLPDDREELGQLARQFDTMASALQKVNRALRTLSAGNRTLVRAIDEQALLDRMCRVIVDVGGYASAWVGYAQTDEGKSIRPMAQAGFEGGMKKLNDVLKAATWADREHGRGPAATAIRTGQRSVMRDLLSDPDYAPWQGQARERGYASAAAFPLPVDGQVIGTLVMYAREPDAFDEEEIMLLAEAAEDLAFGIATLRTRAKHARANETIKRMAYYDGLTALPNHVQFEERLQQALAEASPRGQSLALLLLDLDRFREINDALGFKQGDLLLKEVGERVRHAVSEAATVARMRGDEFAVLLPAGDAARAVDTAQRILSALAAPFTLSGITLDVSGTIGIALSPQHGREVTDLIRHVDVAMRLAKNSGERYGFYAAARDEDTARRLVLARELRHAIEAGELTLYYQAKIDMRSRTVCGAEALVRWIHPQHGMMPPDEFIPLAEHTGLIKPLTEWVLAAALRQSSAWRQDGLALPIAVNLSARNLREATLAEKVKQLLATSGADADWLEIEITESAVMDDPDASLKTLTRLSNLGIALFIDDFGTGHSSLGYLQRLPVDAIKIDKSFVKDMLESPESAAIVRATITLAHDLGIEVVAEGVENQAMWDRLAQFQCDVVAQGYFIGKPAPADEFRGWLARSPWGRAPGGADRHPAKPQAHRRVRGIGRRSRR